MIIDCTKWKRPEDVDDRRVFVDGEQIDHVWYVDTEAGIVKTLNVFGDGVAKYAPNYSKAELPPGVEDRGDRVLSKTIKGKVWLV